MEFAIRLVNSVLNLPNEQVMFFEEFKLKKNCEINSARQKAFGASLNNNNNWLIIIEDCCISFKKKLLSMQVL